jgi:hypothetical protein
VSGVAFDHGVQGGENQMRSGWGHLSKSNVSTSLHTALLRLACHALLSMLKRVHPNSDSKTDLTEPVPEKTSQMTGLSGEIVCCQSQKWAGGIYISFDFLIGILH